MQTFPSSTARVSPTRATLANALLGSSARGLALVLALLLPSAANAVSTFEFLWHDTGTPTITVTATAPFVARGAIRVTADAAGIGGFLLSLAFDEDGADELDIAVSPGAGASLGGYEQTFSGSGSGTFSPYVGGMDRNTLESGPGSAGLLGSFDFVSSGTGLVSATRTVGSVFFTVNPANVTTDGVDVRLVVLDDGNDAILDSSFSTTGAYELSGGSVNAAVPEPGAAVLLAGGLLTLAAIGRRR